MLSVSSPPTAPPPPLALLSRQAPVSPLRLNDVHSPERDAVERFIAAVFRRCYAADVAKFAPRLVSLHDEDGECIAAAGYRPAQMGPLFLERYLSAPVHTLLAATHGRPPPREQIVEVGHLAATRAGAGRRLIGLLGPHLAAQGFDWVVSTLTEELRRMFARLGVNPLALGIADPALLGAQAAQWGSYYDHRPRVLAGRLGAAVPLLARRAATER